LILRSDTKRLRFGHKTVALRQVELPAPAAPYFLIHFSLLRQEPSTYFARLQCRGHYALEVRRISAENFILEIVVNY